jgi:hypothetical protein
MVTRAELLSERARLYAHQVNSGLDMSEHLDLIDDLVAGMDKKSAEDLADSLEKSLESEQERLGFSAMVNYDVSRSDKYHSLAVSFFAA